MDFAIQTRGTFEYLTRAAEWAEANNIVALALPDHYVAGRSPSGSGYDTSSSDIFPYLGALAAQTQQLELATLVSPVTIRHPAHLLKLGLAMDELSGGRFAIGFGTGWMKAEHELYGFPLPPWDERFDRLEEALLYVTSALSSEGGFSGTYYSLAEGPQSPTHQNLRIILGGSGPKRSPDLAGRFADEFNIYSLPGPALARRIERFQEAARNAGRDLATILLSSAGAPVIGATNAEYRQRIEALAQVRAVDVDELEKSFRDVGTPMGTHEEARETFGGTVAAGVTRFYIQLFASMDFDYASEVIEVLDSA